MNESDPNLPIAYLNGEFLPFGEAKLPIYDLAIVQGATVTERLRTVEHHPYLLREHLQRLRASLDLVGWGMPLDMGPLEDVVADVVRRNATQLHAEDDLSVVIFVSAGQAIADANGLATRSRPSVCVMTAPLPLASWAGAYREGLSLVVPQLRQMGAETLSPHIKHRSRLHWHLANAQAQQFESDAAALLLDHSGFVTETSTGNLFVVRDGHLLTPRAETTLQGIAQQHVFRLAQAAGWNLERTNLTPGDVAGADEAFLTSSTYCVLPVGTIDGQRIGQRLPGPVTKMLIDNWSEELGLDLESQVFAAEERAMQW